MSITSSLTSNGEVLNISIAGRFDASCLEEFRKSFEDDNSGGLKSYVVDLSETIHLDSSALGMLLVLRDHAGGDKADITIDNCSPEVKKIFTISSFEQLFNIK
ncbi:MAG: anti-anti-sigma factor [Alteromonadaceae bacterium]|nr:MAG: anti-anti-sigma factor [Alteromonadaceae bacterium]